MFLAQENARKTPETGVTTVRDLGSWSSMDFAMRDLINRGAMVGAPLDFPQPVVEPGEDAVPSPRMAAVCI